MKKHAAIGQRIKELRERFSKETGVELPQQTAAKRFHVSLRAYQNYETGERIPPGPVLSKMASFYRVSIDHILTGEKYLSQDLLDKLEKTGWQLDAEFKELFLIWSDLDEEDKREVFKYMKDKQRLSELLHKHKK